MKSSPLLLGLFLIIGFFIGHFAGGLINQATVPTEHSAIIKNTVIKAYISSAEPNATLTPVLIETGNQKIAALDISDIARKARWVNQELPYTLWKWTYQGEPLVLMRIWGPKDGECLVEIGKMTMTKIYVDVAGQTRQFPIADPAFGSFEGYWYIYVKVSYS